MANQDKPEKSEVLLERGIMRIYYRGKQSAEEILALGDKADEIAEGQRERGEALMTLVDVGELGSFGEPEIKAWRHLMATRSFDRMAIVHMNPALKVVLHFMMKVANRGDRIQVFEDEDEAIKWLREAEPDVGVN